MEEKVKYSLFARMRILWGGGNLIVLQQCPSEAPKYIGYGNTILLTAVLATVSGACAMYAVVDSFTGACLFGPLWGYVIFNLDCAILRSMRKPKIPTKSESTVFTGENNYQ